MALRTRGQFALADQRPDQAEAWLSRAVQAMPNDYQTRWLLAQSLQQQKKEHEAKVQLSIAESMKATTERIGDLRSRKLSEQPLDPALHYEMGILLMRSGQVEIGARWLERSEPRPRARPRALVRWPIITKDGEMPNARRSTAARCALTRQTGKAAQINHFLTGSTDFNTPGIVGPTA